MLAWRFVRLSLKTALEYRADFFLLLGIGAIWQTTVLVFATVLITRFPGMGGWGQGDVLLIAAIRMTGHTLAGTFFMGSRDIVWLTQRGQIDAFLLRPMPVYRQVMLSHFHVPVIGDLAVAIVLLCTAVSHLTLHWTPWRIAYLIIAVIGAMLLEAAVQTFLGSFGLRRPGTSQWQDWAEELMSTFGNYPLHILPNLARAVFIAGLPIAFSAYFPAAVLTGHASQLPVPAWLAAASPVVSFLLYLGARATWSGQLRRYESVGG